eukprot:m.108618 g.108618  ORF g.108618 m.108618 type:complete len:298 (+) comp9192_c0_seq8:1185-2078(+)
MNGVKQSNICCLEDVHQPEIRDLIATIRDHSKELSDMKDHPSISLVLKIIDHLEWVQCSSSKEVFLAIFMEVEEMVFSAAVQLQDYLVCDRLMKFSNKQCTLLHDIPCILFDQLHLWYTTLPRNGDKGEHWFLQEQLLTALFNVAFIPDTGHAIERQSEMEKRQKVFISTVIDNLNDNFPFWIEDGIDLDNMDEDEGSFDDEWNPNSMLGESVTWEVQEYGLKSRQTRVWGHILSHLCDGLSLRWLDRFTQQVAFILIRCYPLFLPFIAFLSILFVYPFFFLFLPTLVICRLQSSIC